MAQPAGERQQQPAADRGRRRVDRDGIAKLARPMLRTDADAERQHREQRQRNAVPSERDASVAIDDIVQRQRQAACREIWQGFDADRQQYAAQRTGRVAAPPRAVRPCHRRHGQQRERDLHVVMIDPSRRELLVRRDGKHREEQRNHRRFAAGNPPRDRGHARHGGKQPQQRPPRAHQSLGVGLVGEQMEKSEQARQAGIDQPRPMHVDADRRLQPRLMQVVPAAQQARAVEPRTHLDQPHRVVGVEQRFRSLRPVQQEQHQRHHQPRQAEQSGEIRLTVQIDKH